MMQNKSSDGTSIGMDKIKQRRTNLHLKPTYPDLTVGQCVPFYFCPRSVMLYVLHCGNAEGLTYHGGQEPLVHLVFDLQHVLQWAQCNHVRICYTSSNAGSRYFKVFTDFDNITTNLNWQAIDSTHWAGRGIDASVKEQKQAECLVENKLSSDLIENIGVHNAAIEQKVQNTLHKYNRSIPVQIRSGWYY